MTHRVTPKMRDRSPNSRRAAEVGHLTSKLKRREVPQNKASCSCGWQSEWMSSHDAQIVLRGHVDLAVATDARKDRRVLQKARRNDTQSDA